MIQWDFWVPFWDMVFYWDSHRGVTIAETKKLQAALMALSHAPAKSESSLWAIET